MSLSLAEALSSSDAWIVEKAQIASEIEIALKYNTIGKEEAKEILENIISTDNLKKSSSNDKLKAALVFGVTQIISLCA